MGTLALEMEMLSPKDYITLGLKSFGKDSLGKPQILSLVSTYLERCVQENERILETSEIEDAVTIFHGLRAPSLSIQQYVDRIFKYSCCSPSCFVIAHIYLDRYIQRTDIYVTSLNVHRLLITSVMVAAKFMDDAFFNNAYYARVGGISTTELNNLELKFLFGIDFQLHVSVQTFGEYCTVLKKEATGSLVERPIQACGTKGSWANNDDPACAQSIAR